MILARTDDAGRFDKAMPHVQALLDAADQRSQALGHMIAGSIDLDRSGIAREITGAEDGPAGQPAQPKLRASALNHLKLAAAGLPDIAEAQAKYGVALVLTQEQNLGRQYLQNALRLGNLDPQYQLWAAWTILQAGYPEEAEPIVQAMLRQVDQGTLPARPGGDAPPPPWRAPPGPPQPRGPEEGRRGVRQGDGRRPGRDPHGRHAAGADRRPARPVRSRPVAARRACGRRARGARPPSSSRS